MTEPRSAKRAKIEMVDGHIVVSHGQGSDESTRQLSFGSPAESQESIEDFSQPTHQGPLPLSTGSSIESDDEDDDLVSLKYALCPNYQVLNLVGRGSFGLVAKARESDGSRDIVAIKRVENVFRNVSSGKRVLREVCLLRYLGDHPCIVSLKRVLRQRGTTAQDFNTLYLIMDWSTSDLFKVLNSSILLNHTQVNSIMEQVLRGVRYLHFHRVVHRDVKPGNVLVSMRSKDEIEVKLADFGLARWLPADHEPAALEGLLPINDSTEYFDSLSAPPPLESTQLIRRKMSQQVVTPLYRAPEIIIGEEYDLAIDLWSVGCLFAELLHSLRSAEQADGKPAQLFKDEKIYGFFQTQQPLFALETPTRPIDSTLSEPDKEEMIGSLVRVLGAPVGESRVEQTIKHMYPDAPKSAAKLNGYIPWASPESRELLFSLLEYDPLKRISAAEALLSSFFLDTSAPPDEPGLARNISSYSDEESKIIPGVAEVELSALTPMSQARAIRGIRSALWRETSP